MDTSQNELTIPKQDQHNTNRARQVSILQNLSGIFFLLGLIILIPTIYGSQKYSYYIYDICEAPHSESRFRPDMPYTGSGIDIPYPGTPPLVIIGSVLYYICFAIATVCFAWSILRSPNGRLTILIVVTDLLAVATAIGIFYHFKPSIYPWMNYKQLYYICFAIAAACFVWSTIRSTSRRLTILIVVMGSLAVAFLHEFTLTHHLWKDYKELYAICFAIAAVCFAWSTIRRPSRPLTTLMAMIMSPFIAIVLITGAMYSGTAIMEGNNQICHIAG